MKLLKKMLCCVLCLTLLASSALGLMVSASNVELQEGQGYTVQLNNSRQLFDFACQLSGFYRITVSCSDSASHKLTIKDQSNRLVLSAQAEGSGLDEVAYMSEGMRYTLEPSLGSDKLSSLLTGTSKTCTIQICHIGNITSRSYTSPHRTKYVKDYDFIYFEDNNGITTSSYVSPDLTGLELLIRFDSGFAKRYDSTSCRFFMNFACPNEVGEQHIYFNYFDTLIIPISLTIVENPITGIEITQLPNKTKYVYGVDLPTYSTIIRRDHSEDITAGALALEGIEITATLRDGSVRTYSAEDVYQMNDCYVSCFEGKQSLLPMDYRPRPQGFDCENIGHYDLNMHYSRLNVGKNTVTLELAGFEAELEITLTNANFLQRFLSQIRYLMKILSSIF